MNEGSFVQDNTAGVLGGGIRVFAGTLTMNLGSFVTGNTSLAAGRGGRIFGSSDRLTRKPGSTVQGNEPDDCQPNFGDCH